MSGRLDPAEFISGFVAEADDLIRLGNAALLSIEGALRKGAAPPARAVREVFRTVHTIKGLAAMVGVEPIVAIAHRMESSLRQADLAGGKLPLAGVDAMLEGLRTIEQRLRAVADRKPVPVAPKKLLDDLDALADAPSRGAGRGAAGAVPFLAGEPALAAKLTPAEVEQLVQGAGAGRRAVRLEFVPSPERAAAGLNITTVRERVATIAEIVRVVPVARPQSEAAPGGLSFVILALSDAADEPLAAAVGLGPGDVRTLIDGAQDAAEPWDAVPLELDLDAKPQRRDVVRVEVSRLDDAMERLGALTVTRYKLARAVGDLAQAGIRTRELDAVVKENARQLRDLRAAILRVRMVAVAEVLERVPLVVRGLRRATGKAVRLEIDAGNAELDKAVAERLFPAIVHLVRNAVDHALESPDERAAAGKPEDGLLRIASFERSNTQLELVVEDDGRGIDAAAVAARAGRPVPKTDQGLLDLICLPGLSTKDEASTTSGRGMGMDIVRRIVAEELGGELQLRTQPGKGTTFTLRVPLTISIIDAFSLECAAQRFVVPVSMIEEIVEVSPAQVIVGPAERKTAANGGDGEPPIGMIQRRGEAVPLVRLEDAFHLAPSGGGGGTKALVVRRGGTAIAFAVDRMLGQQEVVVRPLEDRYTRVPGVSGATDLGDGRPTLVLDLISLGARLAAFLPKEIAS